MQACSSKSFREIDANLHRRFLMIKFISTAKNLINHGGKNQENPDSAWNSLQENTAHAKTFA
jgi:hypothetical protein